MQISQGCLVYVSLWLNITLIKVTLSRIGRTTSGGNMRLTGFLSLNFAYSVSCLATSIGYHQPVSRPSAVHFVWLFIYSCFCCCFFLAAAVLVSCYCCCSMIITVVFLIYCCCFCYRCCWFYYYY